MAYNDDTTSINSVPVETVIGPQTKFVGSVKTDKPIKIEGIFEGEIESENGVIITESGFFKGTAVCSSFILLGKATGKVTADTFAFENTGVYSGDIVAANLLTVKGCIFDGNIEMSSMNKK